MATDTRRENLTFEVAAIDDQGGDSLIKKFPPKKFQKLEEQQHPEQLVTQEILEEKQAIAEKRRKEILTQRIKSAKTTSVRSAQARARAAESKEVDKTDDTIEAGQFVNNDQVGM